MIINMLSKKVSKKEITGKFIDNGHKNNCESLENNGCGPRFTVVAVYKHNTYT